MDSWFILLIIFVSTVGIDAQQDPKDFISIDCGLDANSSYIDREVTNLTYVADDQFIDTGVNYKISPQYATTNYNLFKQFLNVRSFPNGTRNCYSLRSLTIGSRYLVRGTFFYGNYDNLNKPPIFDIYLGVNYWDTVNITTKDGAILEEIIAVATSDYLQVCLINTNLGTPFISALELRPLAANIYKFANSTQSLVYAIRLNLGATSKLRYPNDSYDRIWQPYMLTTWKNISTSYAVHQDPDYEIPSIVMQTAATTLSSNQSLVLRWDWANKQTAFLVLLHISEIQDLPSTARREFDIFSENLLMFNSIVPDKLYADWFRYVDRYNNEYNVSLKATSNATLPPLLNAFELFVITPATGIPTDDGDVAAMNAIKANYQVNKGWNGDPCVPKEYSWSGVTCTSDSTNSTPRITTIDLSKCGLAGAITSSFGNLSALKTLDLSYNNLSGDLPSFLDKLSALTYLDITGNSKLSTTLPPGLDSKYKNGNLIFKSVPGDDTGKDKKHKNLALIIAVAVVVVLLIAAVVIIVVCLRRRKDKQSNMQRPNEDSKTTPQANNHVHNYANTPKTGTSQAKEAGQNYMIVSRPNEVGEGILDFENRRFSYNDLVRITNNFQKNIGTGGFGSVYLGGMKDGSLVAVKMRSYSSSQGVREFLAEAQNLTRVHHKNLVSLIGYCMDGDCMALVYEYMQEGTLQDNLIDKASPLSWKERVRIAYESALGLEYLHEACNPPLIHRDVKSSNILLNANLEARIADFGLSREFTNTASTHVSTAVMGTPGYLDPEYYTTYKLSEKSDVFSFGVVLLEIITGQRPIIPGLENGHLKEWVNEKLSRGDIESIVDPAMHGQYDINSVWKVTELACKCTENSSAHRPKMNVVVAELKESLDLEISTESTRGMNTTANLHNHSRNDNYATDVSQKSVFEMANIGSKPTPGPSVR